MLLENCGNQNSTTTGLIHSKSSSSKPSWPVDVHCHGYLPTGPTWECSWAKWLLESCIHHNSVTTMCIHSISTFFWTVLACETSWPIRSYGQAHGHNKSPWNLVDAGTQQSLGGIHPNEVYWNHLWTLPCGCQNWVTSWSFALELCRHRNTATTGLIHSKSSSLSCADGLKMQSI